MALQRMTINGYGQLELNQVSFPRDGRSESQCKLKNTFTKSAPCEVGMLLAVDKAKGVVQLPGESEKLPIALNYSTEKQYDPRHGLKDFYQYAGGDYDSPRMGYLAVGEIFTTNCICYDSSEFTADTNLFEALKTLGETPIYGTSSTLGAIKVTKTEPATGIYLKAVKYTTMPDGQPGIKFQVVKA